jgi:hypothetical protein
MPFDMAIRISAFTADIGFAGIDRHGPRRVRIGWSEKMQGAARHKFAAGSEV